MGVGESEIPQLLACMDDRNLERLHPFAVRIVPVEYQAN